MANGLLIGAAALGYQQMTSLSSATAPTVPAGTAYMVVQCETQAVRWRDDGSSPTASVGMRLVPGDVMTWDGDKSTQLKFIEELASAKLNISYYG